MEDIFFHKKGKQILLTLNKKTTQNITEITSATGGTYAHTFNLLREMEGQGIVKSAKEGRTKHIKLTPKGKRLATLAIEFENTLKKKGKKAAPTGTTPTHGKLEKYIGSLVDISLAVKGKKLSKKDVGKNSRVLGRYRSLVNKLRPRDKAGKKLKSDALHIVEKIDSMLK
ncbi:winged helix DNA-binding protein [archaeon]|nr:winged helix DNA-binding protein [archaeon]